MRRVIMLVPSTWKSNNIQNEIQEKKEREESDQRTIGFDARLEQMNVDLISKRKK